MASRTVTLTIPPKDTGVPARKASAGTPNPNAGGQENAGGNDTRGEKAKAVGQESRSEFNISGSVVGAGMVGVLNGGTNTVTNSAATPVEKKPKSSQETVGGNATDGQEAVGGNATGGQKAVSHESGAVYNIRPQVQGAGIVGVVNGGINTVKHFPVPQGEPGKDNKENDKGDQEAIGGNNTGVGKSVGKKD